MWHLKTTSELSKTLEIIIGLIPNSNFYYKIRDDNKLCVYDTDIDFLLQHHIPAAICEFTKRPNLAI